MKQKKIPERLKWHLNIIQKKKNMQTQNILAKCKKSKKI